MATTSRYACVAVFLIAGFMMPDIDAISLVSPAQQPHKNLDPDPAAVKMLVEKAAKFKEVISTDIDKQRKQHFINQVVAALNTSEAFNHTKILAVVAEEAQKSGLVSDAKALAKGMHRKNGIDSINVGFSMINRLPSFLQVFQLMCNAMAKDKKPCDTTWMLPKLAVSGAAFVNIEFDTGKAIPCFAVSPHAVFFPGPAYDLLGVDAIVGFAIKKNVPGTSITYDANMDFESYKPLCHRDEFAFDEGDIKGWRRQTKPFFKERMTNVGELADRLHQNGQTVPAGARVERVCFVIEKELRGPDNEPLEGEARQFALEHIFKIGGFDPRGCAPGLKVRDNVLEWFRNPAHQNTEDFYPLMVKAFEVTTDPLSGYCYKQGPEHGDMNENSFFWNTLSTISVGAEHTAAVPASLVAINAAMCFLGTTHGGECYDRARPTDPWTIPEPSPVEHTNKEEWWVNQRVRQLGKDQLGDLHLPTFWENAFTFDVGTHGWAWCASETDGRLSLSR